MAVSLFLTSAVASAAPIPIYLDFGDTRGVPTSPGTWNALVDIGVGASVADLSDSAGDPTGISVSVTDAFRYEGTAGGNWGGTPVSWAVNNATDDNFSVAGGANSTAAITFTGLTGVGYGFSVIASRAVNPDDGIRYGTYAINGFGPDNHSGAFSASQHGWIDRKVMTWANVAPDVNDEIVLALSSSTNGYLSALSFHAIPEPASLSLATIGLLGLLAFSRRRRKH